MEVYTDLTNNEYSVEELLDMVNDWDDPHPVPIIENYDGFNVVRDDLLKYGSKIRFLDYFVKTSPCKEFVFGSSPANGYAQISMPYVCSRYNKKFVLFMAKRNMENLHPYQHRGIKLGGEYHWVNMGMLSVTQSRARKYYEEDKTNRFLLPIGLEHPLVMASIIKVCKSLDGEKFNDIWCVGSSGTISRGLQLSFPNKKVNVVSVGHKMNDREIGNARVYSTPYKFDKEVKGNDIPPFPSAPTYDAKGWSVMKKYGSENDLFWNVGY